MIPQAFAKKFVSSLAVGFGTYVAKSMGESTATFLATEIPKLEDPVLLVALPLAIVKETFAPVESPSFECENRAKLHDHCTNAGWFDRMTIPPVNNELNRRGISLTKESLKAIRKDIEHTNQMSFTDPVHKKIEDYHEASRKQGKIAKTFTEAGEHEGALMHNVISNVFSLKAKAYEFGFAPIESTIRGPGQSIE